MNRSVIALIFFVLVGPQFSSAKSCKSMFNENQFTWDWVFDRVNPFVVYQKWILGVSHSKMMPKNFFADDGKGMVVGINGVKFGSIYHHAAEYMAGSHYKHLPNVYQANAMSPGNIVHHLLQAYEKGGPINRMVIAAHGVFGEPATMMIGESKMNSKWWTQAISHFNRLPHDLFTPDAKVILLSCSCGRSPGSNRNIAKIQLREMFEPLLTRGGTIIASTRYVDPNLSEIPYDRVFIYERIRRHFFEMPIHSFFGTAQWLFADWTSMLRKVIEIEVPPQ